MVNDLKLDAMKRELTNLQRTYRINLEHLQGKVADAVKKADNGRFSDHDPFNMAAACQELAVLAGKIEQTENVVRWMGEKAE